MEGGKGRALRWLAEIGERVPPWFVIAPSDNPEKKLQNAKLHGDFFAVRSSAQGEDGSEHSFAGMFETYLNVARADLVSAIERCRQSARSDRVRAYAAGANIPDSALDVSVVVQQMLKPRSAGVFFTAHPNGNINQMLVETAPGLGDAVVDARVEVERWIFYKFEKRWENTAKPYRDFCLKAEDLAELAALAERLEAKTEGFLDIEFAFEEQLWLLQARPITTFKSKKIRLYDGANIQENYPRLNTPLTFSALKRGYEANFTQLLKHLGVDNKTLTDLAPALHDMIEPVRGHIYYRLDNWYEVLQIIPFLANKAISSFQGMIGTGVRPQASKVKAGPKIILRLVSELVRGLVFRDQYESRYRQSIRPLQREAQRVEKLNLTGTERWKWAHQWMERTYQSLYYPLLNDFFCGFFLHALANKLKKLSVDTGILNAMVMGVDEIESARCVREIQKLAQTLATDQVLQNRLKRISNHTEAEAFLNSAHPFAQEALSYLNRFGERTIEEMKIEVAGLTERPLDFFKYLFALIDSTWAQEESEHVLKRRDDAWKAWQALPFNFVERFFWNQCLKQYIRALAFREESRFDRVRGKGPFRRAALALGVEWHKSGKLAAKEDIFWMTIDEIEAGGIALEEIAKRKTEWSGENMPARFAALDGHPLPTDLAEHTDIPSDWRGIGCTSGVVEGEVVVIKQAEHGQDVRGKILVTETTDPGWVFLMIQAKALVIERGSLLSHAAIIGRELGIPTVIGVKGAMRGLEGKRVRVFGATGEIQLLDKA